MRRLRLLFSNTLKTKQMTKKPKAKKGEKGKWLKNNARAKAGLNKSTMDWDNCIVQYR